MTRMILAKGIGAALALAVMAGFVGQATAGLREYCDSYARDVANRKTNGVAGATGGNVSGLTGHGNGVGSTVFGAGVSNDRYKRVYTNAYERCVNNYEGAGTRDASAGGQATDQNVTNKKAAASAAADKNAASSNDAPDKTTASNSEATDETSAANEAANKKVAASAEVTDKKVAASKPTEKKVAANEAVNKDEACARKYRSYDPQIGKYKSLTGKWRPCRL